MSSASADPTAVWERGRRPPVPRVVACGKLVR